MVANLVTNDHYGSKFAIILVVVSYEQSFFPSNQLSADFVSFGSVDPGSVVVM